MIGGIMTGAAALRGGYYTNGYGWEAGKDKSGEAGSRFTDSMNIANGNVPVKKNPTVTGESAGAVPAKGKGAPYSYLADKNGLIEYKGVVFKTDHEQECLCLGDTSDMDNVIQIPLSKGGRLLVNRDCVDQLSAAIGMFSPADVNLILRALRMDAKVREMKKEMEEMEDGDYAGGKATLESSDEKAREFKEDAKKLLEKAEKAEVMERIRNGEKETSFLTGGSAFTRKQWTGLMDTIDEALDTIKQGIAQETEKAEEEAKAEAAKKKRAWKAGAQ